jgi:hypothetical protein
MRAAGNLIDKPLSFSFLPLSFNPILTGIQYQESNIQLPAKDPMNGQHD